MKIGIDCRLWNETGLGRYIRNIVEELSKTDTKNEYVLFVLSKDVNSISLPSNFKLIETNVRWYTFAEQFKMPFYYYREKLDILWYPNINVSILYLKRFVVTIHDLTVTKMKTGRASTLPYPFYLLKRIGVFISLWYCAIFSKKIFTVSNFVKKEIVSAYKVKEEKILITVNSVDPKFRPSKENLDSIMTKYKISRPYIFYVGNAHPHKNIEGLIQAFELVINKKPELTLVLGGSKKFFYERMEEELKDNPISTKVRFIGFVDDLDLPVLYSGAEALVNASFYEGFGIQVLEAFACGTKVVCSNTTSLPEVGGNIAYYFNPRDIKNMSTEIVNCVEDKDEQRVNAGFERVKKYSWEKSSKIVFDVLNSFNK